MVGSAYRPLKISNSNRWTSSGPLKEKALKKMLKQLPKAVIPEIKMYAVSLWKIKSLPSL